MRYAAGDNFTVDMEDGVAIARVFRNVELDQKGLERCAGELVGYGRVLMLSEGVAGFVVDLRRVPGAVSPEVAKCYADLVLAWETTGQRIAFLVLDDALQMMQLGRILSANGPRFGALMTDRNEARKFVGSTGGGANDPSSRMFERPSRIKRT
jgi:hypothetical protein